MDLLPASGLAAAGGYLCGSIPFAYLAVRLKTGKDIRTVGSGNVGATNAARVLGRPWFFAVFLADFLKGALPVLLVHAVLMRIEGLDRPSFDRDHEAWVRASAGLGAVLGHLFPAWLGFRGGKGVATGAGAVFGMAPASTFCGVAGFLLVAGVTRYVSLGSIGAAIAVPTAFWFLSKDSPPGQRIPIGGLLVAVSLFVVLRHLPNFRRIAAGTEPKMFSKPAAPAGGEASREE